MCSTDVYCSKQTGSSSTKGNHHPSFLRFWIGQKKTVDAAKICGGAEKMLLKQKTQQTFVNGLLGFITLAFIPCWKRVCIAYNILRVAHRYGQLYLHCSLIYFWVPSAVFAYDQPLSEGEIIPFSGVCQSGGGCIIHAGGRSRRSQTVDKNRNFDDQRQHHHAEYHFQL